MGTGLAARAVIFDAVATPHLDGTPPVKLTRFELLTTFFGREVGDRVKLELADPQTKRRRMVELESNGVRTDRPAGARKT